jgi:methylthioribose-1-phosphate isomerase
MKINGVHQRTIWLKKDDPTVVQIIDQRHLPHRFIIEELTSLEEAAHAIEDMHVRGAPLIGSTAAYGMYLALLNSPDDTDLQAYAQQAAAVLKATRPTAVNLAHAVDQVLAAIAKQTSKASITQAALEMAHHITEESVDHCSAIGQHGLELIKAIEKKKGKGEPVNILTHCNAGWIACIDYGTATAPIYAAHAAGIKVHVWVDETRPRNQGARITAYELAQEGVPHTVIADNTGGHLMQHGMVDMVLVGADRVTASGDVANKIGTYLKALAAKDNGVPFYVALPSSTFDFMINDGLKEIPIEERSPEEVQYIQGWHDGEIYKVRLTPAESPASNYAFDVTPARLVSGLISERGICEASPTGIETLYSEKKVTG